MCLSFLVEEVLNWRREIHATSRAHQYFYQWALRAPLIYMRRFVTLLEGQVEEGVNLKHLEARDNAQLTN